MNKNIISLENIAVSFDGEKILNDINLDIKDKEFVTFLGPSGCGKTTTLRLIGGFLKPDSGIVRFDGKEINNIPPYKRNVNTVFQRYALFPHLNVYDNIAFGLKIKKFSDKEIQKRVGAMLELVNLKGFEKRSIDRLSGGQQQRVAIARALVNEPKVLLLDEPLGALDLKLRKDMQIELKRIQQSLEITFIYVTHDQEEAINMSDRIVVMNQGRFEQIGTPDEIYNHPKTSYVATFVGNANILKGELVGMDGTVAIRSENIILDETCKQGYSAVVKEKNFAAGQLRVLLALPDGTEITASRFGMNANIQPGQKINWYFDPKNAVVVDKIEGERS